MDSSLEHLKNYVVKKSKDSISRELCSSMLYSIRAFRLFRILYPLAFLQLCSWKEIQMHFRRGCVCFPFWRAPQSSIPPDRRKMSLQVFHPVNKELTQTSSVSNKIFLNASLMKNHCLFGESVHSLTPQQQWILSTLLTCLR